MKLTLSAVTTLVLAGTLLAKDPTPRPRKSTLGKYPAIIQLTPADPTAPAAASGLFHSELGGREVQFLQEARQSAGQLLTLAQTATAREASEQVKSVAEMLASMQATESGKLEELATAKKLPPAPAHPGLLMKDLAGLTGAKFEKAWLEKLIGVTEGSVQAYEVGGKSNDAEVKAFVEKMLPVAKARLQMANRLGGRSVSHPGPAPVPVEARPPASGPAAVNKAPAEPAPIAPPVEGTK